MAKGTTEKATAAAHKYVQPSGLYMTLVSLAASKLRPPLGLSTSCLRFGWSSLLKAAGVRAGGGMNARACIWYTFCGTGCTYYMLSSTSVILSLFLSTAVPSGA